MASEAEPIPLFRFHQPAEAGAALAAVLASGQLAAGPAVRAFEALLAGYVGNGNCVAVSDRSGALTLALRLAGVGPGAEVILSPLTCLATSMPIANCFARPVWADIDPATGMLAAAAIPALITPRTRAIVAYHWGGDVADLAPLTAVARAHGVRLIDDASAAFGAEYRGRRLGNTDTDFTVHSFYAVNPLATGEGGALFCRNPAECAQAGWLRRYGIHPPSFRLSNGDLNPASDIPVAGYNFAMNELAAALGGAQFAHLEPILARHRAHGSFYSTALRGIPGLTLLQRDPGSQASYWVYGLRAERRDALIDKLHAHGIGAQRLHLRNDRYGCFTPAPASLPGVERFDAENLCIPCGWWVSDAARARIVACIKAGW